MIIIEDHLDSKIDTKELSIIGGYSFSNIERAFAFIFQMTIAEYIRLRRLSLAALELINSDSSILDIALKYGYSSHESFSRAFVSLHGLIPSEARNKYSQLKFCQKAVIEKVTRTSIQIDFLHNQPICTLNNLKIRDTFPVSMEILKPELQDPSFELSPECLHINGDILTISCPEKKFYLQTQNTYTLPLKIDLEAATDSTNLKLLFGRGDITLNWKYSNWNYKTNELMIHDIFTGACYGYPEQGKIAEGVFHHISWIIKPNFMALLVDGKLRLYNEYFPYSKELLSNPELQISSKVGIAASWGSTVTVKN